MAGVEETPGTYAGSFPSSYVAFMKKLGTAPFWYASGASTDPFKVALPIGVAYDASGGPQPTPTAPAQPTATTTVTAAPTGVPTVVTTVTTVPVPISTAVPGFPVLTAPPATAGVIPGAPVGGLPGLEAVGPTELPGRPATRMSLASADVPPEPAWPWGLGVGLLVVSALLGLAQSLPLPASSEGHPDARPIARALSVFTGLALLAGGLRRRRGLDSASAAGAPTLSWRISQYFDEHLSDHTLGDGASESAQGVITFPSGVGTYDSATG